jgi:Domain of unknown function (DUF4276)
MIRLHFVVEGQTEELFVEEVLAPDLNPRAIYPAVRCVQTGERGSHPDKGGGSTYRHWKADIEHTLRSDNGRDLRLTTMVDLYRLPRDFPGLNDEPYRHCLTPESRVAYLESQFLKNIGDPRFVPYIQLHEFEALLFAQPSSFSTAYPDEADRVSQLAEARRPFRTVDEIDDGKATAPSERIVAVFPEYRTAKPAIGTLVALEIGLDRILAESPHFRQWIERLRNLKPLGEPAPSDVTN